MEKKNKLPLIWVSAICTISIVIMMLALAFPVKESDSASFVPPPFDECAIQGVPDVPDGLGWKELDVKAYKASICGEVIVEGSNADVWFTNPIENDVWLKLRVLDEAGNIIGETGIIKPGEYVRSVSFMTVPGDGDAISLKLMGYEPKTYYSTGSATLNTTVKGENSK